jgi:thioredoxin reductase
VYVVGELGGMGLIRNAFEQGRQCIEGIAREERSSTADVLDLLIVGCGPAGLSTSLHAQQRGLRFITLEREEIGGTVRTYPRKKLVMTEPVKIPGFGKLGHREILREELVQVWDEVVSRAGLGIRTGETVRTVVRESDGSFAVTSDRDSYRTKRVVLAIGRRGTPRKLGVPGEESPKVFYSLRDPDQFSGDRILVVGGGDAAVEAALALSQSPGNQVSLSYRGTHFRRIKPANLERLEEAVHSARVELLLSTEVTEILPDAVSYQDQRGGASVLPNDYVFIMIGGELPTDFLRSIGVEIDTRFGAPVRS